jgi:hypothetical protein
VKQNQGARFKFVIAAAGKEFRLISNLLKKYRSDKSAFNEIVVFQGMEFDKASVEVVLPDGRTRTFNIQSPNKGHAITVDLEDLDLEEDGKPGKDSLFDALRDAAKGVPGSD